MPQDPKVSVVAATRNDDHGGNQLARTQIFINGLAEQAQRLEMPIELVLVEWNPPADRPPLAEALSWPGSAWFDPKIVVVPPEVHRSFPHADGLPLFQMIAKNVGIRRASAPYVLATNIDILLSDELVEYLRGGLDPNTMYRVDRHDIEADLDRKPLPTPAECRALPYIRAHRQTGAHYPDGRREPWHTVARTRLNKAVWDMLHGGPLPKLYTWACGDFTLTSREVWEAMRGYPEWPMYSFHLDSLVMVQAYRAGVEMVTLAPPMVSQHLEHGKGSGWTPEGAQSLFGRLDAAGVPYISGSGYDKLARELLRKEKGFHTFNSREWGLANQELQVVMPGGSKSPARTKRGSSRDPGPAPG
ncbi:MAG TPA: hypothetical protein VGG31_00765 [Candidatus Dormibacteraeota bacterium]|jgi:hypothetical protein